MITENRMRWRSLPFIVDGLLASAVMALQLTAMFRLHEHEHLVDWPVVVEVFSTGSLALRRRFPVVVFSVVVLAVVVHTRFGHFDDGNLFAVLIALYTVSAHVRAAGAVAAAAVVLAVSFVPPANDSIPFDWQGAVWGILTMVITATLGQVQRRSRQRAQRLEQALGMLGEAHRKLADEAVAVERNRIARELHDIVAHGLSLIAMHAGVARTSVPTDPDQAVVAIGVIEKASRESLAEMRHMLGVLRSSDEDGGCDRQPQPGLQRVPDLIEQARSSGLDLDLVRHGEPHHLSPGQELVAYRILQEALTNVLKHAGPVRATATLRYLAGRLVIDVFNEVPADPVVLPVQGRGGHGLIGMRERVGMYGGTVTAGAVDGGFRVTAELPVDANTG